MVRTAQSLAGPTLDLVKGETQEIPYQGVYRLDDNGKVTLLTKDLTQPNGLAFSPDGKRLYVDDSAEKNIRVYDVQPDGTLANGRIFGEEKGNKGEGVPDGMRVDRKGNIFDDRPEEASGFGIHTRATYSARSRCPNSSANPALAAAHY